MNKNYGRREKSLDCEWGNINAQSAPLRSFLAGWGCRIKRNFTNTLPMLFPLKTVSESDSIYMIPRETWRNAVLLITSSLKFHVLSSLLGVYQKKMDNLGREGNILRFKSCSMIFKEWIITDDQHMEGGGQGPLRSSDTQGTALWKQTSYK